MLVRDVMQRVVKVVGPDQTVRDAAHLMDLEDVGCLPVVEDGRPVGIITDRDIAVRVAGEGKDPMATSVAAVMSEQFITCHEDDEIDAAVTMMGKDNVRRLPVVGRQGNGLVGIVSLDDLAGHVLDNKFVGMILSEGTHAPKSATTGPAAAPPQLA